MPAIHEAAVRDLLGRAEEHLHDAHNPDDRPGSIRSALRYLAAAAHVSGVALPGPAVADAYVCCGRCGARIEGVRWGQTSDRTCSCGGIR